MAKGNTSTISLAEFRIDWMAHVPMRALCERWTITRDQVIRLKHVWKLPPRHDRRLRAKPERQSDPTTTQIRDACLKIQATWSDEVRELRKVTKSQPYQVRRIELASDLANEVFQQWMDDE